MVDGQHRCRQAHPRTSTAVVVLTLLCAPAAPALAQLGLPGNYLLPQSAVGGLVETGDRFGASLAAGDFNGDGYDDLAIGVPEEDVGAVVDAGAVFVAYGSASGLGAGAPAPQSLHQDVAGVADSAETDERFGAALAAGDFNGDGYDDLAVGVPGQDVIGGIDGGAIHLFLGGAGGLVVAGTNDYLYGALLDPIVFASSNHRRFGSALLACDLNNDGRDDLVIGIPARPREEGLTSAGAIMRLFGVASGVTTASFFYYSPADGDNGDLLGTSLACGDLDQAGGDDLLIGAPAALDVADVKEVGAVWTVPASGAPTVARGSEASARKGGSVAAGDFAADGHDVVVYGTPFSNQSDVLDSGRVNVDGQPIYQGLVGVEDDSETFDHFGAVVAVGDFDRDGLDDLVVGVPDEDLYDGTKDLAVNGGLMQVIYGQAGGILTNSGTVADDAVFHWGQVAFGAMDQDNFGAALAVGDFNRDGIDDLAVGGPGALFDGQLATGVVQIYLGSRPNWIFGDGFATGLRKWVSLP